MRSVRSLAEKAVGLQLSRKVDFPPASDGKSLLHLLTPYAPH